VFAVRAVAPACWNQQSLSFAYNREMNSARRFWYRPALFPEKNNCPHNSPSGHLAPHVSFQWFRCEVMFENEHTFRSWMHHVRTCTAFAQLAWAAA
jgi:hypothetical protein